MNDAEYADRAENGVISKGQNDTSSWEVTYDPDFTDRVFEAVNYMSDVQDSVDNYRMHLRHYQEEVRDLKSEIESLKFQLKGPEDLSMKGALKHLSFNSTGNYPIIEDVQECQDQFYADAVRAPHYDGPHNRYLPGDCVWAIACGRGAVNGIETEVRVGVWQGDVPTGDTVNYKGVWRAPSDAWELAKVQIISVKEQHDEP